MTDLYMDIDTGTIQTKEEWLDDICAEELKMTGYDTEIECFESYIDEGIYVEVDEKGNEIK